MKAQANAQASLLVSAGGLAVTLVAASVFGEALAATKMGTVCGGLVGATAFFNALHLITGLEATAAIRSQTGIIEGASARRLGPWVAVRSPNTWLAADRPPAPRPAVALALVIAGMTGGIIHRVSVTTRCGRAARGLLTRCLMLTRFAARPAPRSVLFSFVALYYVMGASDAIHGGDSGVRVTPSKAPARRKR